MDINKINILNKEGMLTDEDRKQPLSHGCNSFSFESCVDLSKGIDVIPYGNSKQFSLDQYSQDIASFMCWWTTNVMKDLNGFSGFSHVKFRLPEGTELIDTSKL